MPIEAATAVAKTCGWICQFGKLNATVQAGVIGASSALVATFLASLVTAITVVVQLHFQRRERARDRALEIKKDILFEMLNGIAAARTAINQMLNLDFPLRTAQENFNQGDARAQTGRQVASIPIVASLRRYTDVAAISFLDLLRQRSSLDQAKRELDDARARLAFVGERRNELRQRHLDLAISKNPADAEAESNRLVSVSEGYDNAQQEAFGQCDRAIEKLGVLMEPFQDNCINAQLRLNPFVDELIHLVRIEIGVDRKKSTDFLSASRSDGELQKKTWDEIARAQKIGQKSEAHR